MIQLYLLALILTSAFTLLPGRIMHNVIFGCKGTARRIFLLDKCSSIVLTKPIVFNKKHETA